MPFFMGSPRIVEGRIYPVKGCGPIVYGKEELYPITNKGPLLDREWMVVGRDDHIARTQRDRGYERLALIQPEVLNSNIALTATDIREKLILAFLPAKNERPSLIATVWDDQCPVYVEEEGSEWLQELLKTDCLLVRKSGKRWINRPCVPADAEVHLADRHQFMGISRATLDKLNTLLEKPVNMSRFRPNLIFDGCVAQEENRWEEIRTPSILNEDHGFEWSATTLRGVQPCQRCSVVNVEQETAVRSPEVLKALTANFAGSKGKPIFGENFFNVNGTCSRIRIGDPIAVITRREQGWDREYQE